MSNTPESGHRARLRQRFLENPDGLSESELIELLLTFAVPRRDVAPQAQALLTSFGTIDRLLQASPEELKRVAGVGESTAVLVQLAARLCGTGPNRVQPDTAPAEQLELIDIRPTLGPLFEMEIEPTPREMRTYANDEIDNALAFIPQASQFADIGAFKAHLVQSLPYSSVSTRQRRANYILNRFFPDGSLQVPLVYFASQCETEDDLKPVLFYHVLRAEPLVARVAEDFVWPALPNGRVNRENMRDFILRCLPTIGAASQKNVLRSLFRTYDLLSVGAEANGILRFQVHAGTLEAFLFVLASEFPVPRMYSFDQLERGPMRRWLLWDREWMRNQLYNLRDVGIISKISEIDSMRQFTLQFDQWSALRHYFEREDRGQRTLREKTTL